jgi:flagellar biosynthetic protein FliR
VPIALPEAAIAAYLLALVRAGAWVTVSPPFTGRLLPAQVRAGVAVGLALAAAPSLQAAAVPLEPGPLLSAAVLQAFAGLALGYVIQLVLAALAAAGGLIDMFAGFSAAQLFDPMTASVASPFQRFYGLLGTTLVFASNGHLLVVRGFLRSFQAAPLTSLSMDDLLATLSSGLGRFMVSAVEIAGPLLVALFVADIALGLLSKAAPSANVFVLGIPMKVLLTLSISVVALPLLPNAVQGLLDSALRQGAAVLGMK